MFHANMGTIKDRNGKDIIEAEDIQEKWQEYTNCAKSLNDLDNHDAVISHLEPDILEYEVKWALGNITTNKASGGDGIPAELFQILKKVLPLKCCTHYASTFGKLSSGHRTGKGQFSFQSQRKASAKECSNYCTITLISHASKIMLKSLQARLQQYVNRELPDVQAGFRKGRGTRDQVAKICWIIEKAREFQKNIYFCFIDYTEAFDYVDHNKLENSERDGNTRPPYLPPEKSVCAFSSVQSLSRVQLFATP